MNVVIEAGLGLPSMVVRGNCLADIYEEVNSRLPGRVPKSAYLSHRGGQVIKTDQVFSEDTFLRWNVRMCGGKGGFGHMLKTQGGRMSRKKKNTNDRQETEKDNYKTLDGKSVRAMRLAKQFAKHLESLPLEEKKAVERKKAKLLKIIQDDEGASNAKFSDVKYLEAAEATRTKIREITEKGLEYDGVDNSGTNSASAGDKDNKTRVKARNFFDDEGSDTDSD